MQMVKRFFTNSKEGEERERAAEQVFSRAKRSLSDIVPANPLKKRETVTTTFVEPEARREIKKESFRKKLEMEEPVDFDAPAKQEAEEEESAAPELDERDYSREDGERKSWRKWLVLGLVLLVIVSVGVSLAIALPSAEIRVTLKKSPWEFKGDLTALLSNGDIAAQLFSQSKNLQLPFAATGKKYMETKAAGTMKIFNAFSSEAQGLVANTRFVTPDGKIFRLDKAIVVPGAKIVDGKITPASIDTTVTADKAGPDFNVGSVAKWTIPGFKGSPKFDGFYGVSEGPMAGGAIGEKAFPTEADIGKAKQEAEKQIKDSLSSAFAFQIPQDFKILDNGSNFRITKSLPMPDVDAEGKFKYFIEAKDERIAIREADLNNYLVMKAKAELGDDFSPKQKELKFEVRKIVFKNDNSLNGAVLGVEFSGDFVRSLNVDDLRSRAAGKAEDELRKLILSLAPIEKANISFWPFWVRSVPKKLDKISVDVD